MYLDNPELAKQMAEENKSKREEIVKSNKPYLCKKCGEEKNPKDFVIQLMNNHWVGKYRYLGECKECKKSRMNDKRASDKQKRALNA